MTVREAFKNGTFKELGKPVILMDIHKRAHFKLQDSWNYEIDHIEERQKFDKAIIVMRVQIKRGALEVI